MERVDTKKKKNYMIGYFCSAIAKKHAASVKKLSNNLNIYKDKAEGLERVRRRLKSDEFDKGKMLDYGYNGRSNPSDYDHIEDLGDIK